MSWGKKVKESQYQSFRSFWAYHVILSIYNKHGTPKDNKKRTLANIIRNVIRERHGKSYKFAWLVFHPKRVKDKKTKKLKLVFDYDNLDFQKISESRHIKNANDIWFSKKGKTLRHELETTGQFKKLPIDELDFIVPPLQKDSKGS